MPSIGSLKGTIDNFSRSLKELKKENINSSKEVTKVADELKKMNEIKEKEKLAESKTYKKENDPYPLVKYESNEMTFSQYMVRKLDII